MKVESIQKRLEQSAVEEKTLTGFTCRALRLIGDHIDASFLVVRVRDSGRACPVIQARQSKRHNRWVFESGDKGAFDRAGPVKPGRKPDLSQYPFLCFCLDLPPPWTGEVHVRYSRADQYAPQHCEAVKHSFKGLSHALHIALLYQRCRDLEDRLEKEVRINRGVQKSPVKQGGKLDIFRRQAELKRPDVFRPGRSKKQVTKEDSRPIPDTDENKSAFTKEILKEIEHSRKMVLLGELASGVAHQIRNPLNNLLGALHVIKDDETSEEERQELYNGLTERVESINRMISEFIHYTRITKLNRTPEDINTALKNSLRSIKNSFDLSGVELVTSFDFQLPAINIDLYLMDQVFHNIIKNALEAMNYKGKIDISVQKLMIQHGPKPRLEFVEISFRDTGHGIPEEDINKVINPFYSKKSDGMGLGLSIAKHVVRVHGGAVQIKSRPGRFTNITIYLPVR